MDEFARIKDHVKQDSKVVRYQELERIIHKDQALLKQVEVLKDLQKKLVNAKTLNKPFLEIERDYQAIYDQVLDHPVMGEYLDLVEQINEDLQFVTEIITKEINMDL